MALIIPEDGVEIAQRVVVHVLGDPVPHRAVESGELPAVLLVADAAAAAGAGALSRARGGAVGLLGGDVGGGLGGGGAVERQT